MSLTKARLAENISERLCIPKAEASDLMELVLQIMKDTLELGEELKISGFGKFSVKKKNPRRGRNPQTGESIALAHRQVVTFKASNLLRAAING